MLTGQTNPHSGSRPLAVSVNNTERDNQERTAAVVGAGLSGLACARALLERGLSVTVFDRGRVTGGRLATREAPELADAAFDFGAPFFHADDPVFRSQVNRWLSAGVCASWDATVSRSSGGRLEPVPSGGALYVGMPAMRSLCASMAEGLDGHSSTEITRAAFGNGRWILETDGGTTPGRFDAFVLAMPPEQAMRIAGPARAGFAPALERMTSETVWVCMIGIKGAIPELPDVVEFKDNDAIERIVLNGRKPGRKRPETALLTVYANPGWSSARFESPREAVAQELLDHVRRFVREAAGIEIPEDRITTLRAHRWGFARPRDPRPEPCLVDAAQRLAVCGDAFAGSGVQGAFLSGHAAGTRIADLLGPTGMAQE